MRQVKLVIGLISREYPPRTHVGGIGTYTVTAAKLLVEHGHRVHVFCNGDTTFLREENGIHVHCLRMEPHPLPKVAWLFSYRQWYRKHLPHYLESITWAKTVANYLQQHAMNLKLDVLEYPETNGEGSALSLPHGLQSVHRVCRIHTSWISEYVTGHLESKLLLRLQKKACQLAKVVVSPSRFMANHYTKDILKWNQLVQVNPNPLNLWQEPLMWAEKSPQHLLFVGRIEFRKGLDLLLQVLDSMGNRGNQLTLRVIGAKHPPDNNVDESCQNILEQALLKHSHLQPQGYRLEYLGPVSHSELYQHYDWAGITILPSRQDNYPYTALEALSRGCFVLAASVGGLAETLDGCQGMLFKAEDPDDLGEKIGELAQNDDRVRKSWLSNAQEIAERFQSEACYLRLIQTYADANHTPETSVLPRE